MLIVVRRHTGDQTFNVKLKEALFLGETELQELINEQKAYLNKQAPNEQKKGLGLRQALDLESQQRMKMPRDLNESSSVLNDPNASQRHFLNQSDTNRRGSFERKPVGEGILPQINQNQRWAQGRLVVDDQIYDDAEYDDEYDDESDDET